MLLRTGITPLKLVVEVVSAARTAVIKLIIPDD
jgi:hypothetical protein